MTTTRSLGVESGTDRPHPPDFRPARHLLVDRLVVLVDDVEEVLSLVLSQGPHGNEQRVIGGADRHADADKLVRQQGRIGPLNQRSQPPRARGHVDLVVEKVNIGRAGILVFGRQCVVDFDPGLPWGVLRSVYQLANVDGRSLVDVEIDVHFVGRNQRGQHGLVGADHIARIDHSAADAPGKLRPHGRIVQIHLGGVPLGLDGLDRGGSLVAVAHCQVVVLLADGLGGEQCLGAAQIGLQPFQMSFGQDDVCLGLLELRLVDVSVDLEQWLVLLDHLAVGKVHLLQPPAHHRLNIDRFRRFEVAREVLIIDDLGGLRQRNADLRGRRRRGLLAGVHAAA